MVLFSGGITPTTVIPQSLWSSEKLNLSLKDIDYAIDNKEFNRAVTLSYTCLEGLYKTYIQKYVSHQANVNELIPLSKIVKEHIAGQLKAQESFPEQIVNSIVTITNAVANSRNGFSESHFNDDASKWLAIFARDLTNSIGRLLLHFL
jgi:hypothetical protein